MKVNIGPYATTADEIMDENFERVQEVHIDDYDTWSLDNTIAMVIHPLLVKFRENLHGWPAEMFYLVGVEDLANVTDEQDKAAEEKWNEILDKMIWSFGQVVDDTEDPLYEEIRTGKHFPREAHQVYADKVQEGIDLFAKYFRNLWD